MHTLTQPPARPSARLPACKARPPARVQSTPARPRAHTPASPPACVPARPRPRTCAFFDSSLRFFIALIVASSTPSAIASAIDASSASVATAVGAGLVSSPK